MTDRVGQQLGSYRLLQLLGQGGFAEVYLGEHTHLKQQAYGVLAPQQQAYPQSGPGISGSSPNNVTPV